MKDTSSRSQLKDSELTARVRRGETEWLDVLIERYYDGIFRFCCCKTGSREAAYDCTQETFLHLLRYLEAYTEQKNSKPGFTGSLPTYVRIISGKLPGKLTGRKSWSFSRRRTDGLSRLSRESWSGTRWPVFRKCRGKPSCSISLTGLSCGRLRKSRIQKCLP